MRFTTQPVNETKTNATPKLACGKLQASFPFPKHSNRRICTSSSSSAAMLLSKLLPVLELLVLGLLVLGLLVLRLLLLRLLLLRLLLQLLLLRLFEIRVAALRGGTRENRE